MEGRLSSKDKEQIIQAFVDSLSRELYQKILDYHKGWFVINQYEINNIYELLWFQMFGEYSLRNEMPKRMMKVYET